MVATLDFDLKNAPTDLWEGCRWAVLTMLIVHANTRNRCWLSVDYLVAKLGKSTSTIVAALKWLREHLAFRLVTTKERSEDEKGLPNRQNIYELTGNLTIGELTLPYLHITKENGQPKVSKPKTSKSKGVPVHASETETSETKVSESEVSVSESSKTESLSISSKELTKPISEVIPSPNGEGAPDDAPPAGYEWRGFQAFKHLVKADLKTPKPVFSCGMHYEGTVTSGPHFRGLTACPECLVKASPKVPQKGSSETWTSEVKDALAKLCKLDWTITDHATQMGKTLRSLNGKVTVELLRRFYANWYKCNWRGKRGDAPKPRDVVAEWIALTQTDDCPPGGDNGRPSESKLLSANGREAAGVAGKSGYSDVRTDESGNRYRILLRNGMREYLSEEV